VEGRLAEAVPPPLLERGLDSSGGPGFASSWRITANALALKLIIANFVPSP
jgi:hypothetical protein